MVGSQGLEPRMPKAPDLQSGAVTCSARCPKTISKHTGRGDRFRNRSCLSPMCWDMVQGRPLPAIFSSLVRLHPGLRPFAIYPLTGPRCLGAENKKPWSV